MEEITILKNIPNQSIVLYVGNVYYLYHENQYKYFIEVKLLYEPKNSKTLKKLITIIWALIIYQY